MFLFGPRTGDRARDQLIRKTRSQIAAIGRKAEKSRNRSVRRSVKELTVRWKTLLSRLSTEPLLFPVLSRYFARNLPVVDNLVSSAMQLVPHAAESKVAASTRFRVERMLEKMLADLVRLVEQVDRQAFGDIHDEMDVLDAQFRLEHLPPKE